MISAHNNADLQKPASQFASPVQSVLRSDWTVAQAIDEIRRRPLSHKIIYFYAVDEQERLLGVVPTRKLLLSEPSARIGEILFQPIISISEQATLADAMQAFEQHRLLALPVTDSLGRLVGAIDIELYTEEAIDLAESHRAYDVFQMIGVSIQQVRRGSPWNSFRQRMPWLLCNLAAGIACAAIGALFEAVLARVILLAMFFPLVLTLSESISMQSMTLTLQYLHHRNIRWNAVRRHGKVEALTAVLLGLTSGALVALLSVLWQSAAATMTVLFAAIAASMLASACFGALIPIALRVLKLDPRIASGPVVLMLADVLTTSVYLGLATLILL